MGREPVVEVKNHPWEEARLTDAEQEAQHVEHGAGLDMEERGKWLGKCDSHRDDGPAQHDAGDPEPRAVSMQQQIARNLKQEVAPEENAGAQGVDGITELQILQHAQFRESDVHPVEIGSHVTQQ
ncbi:hypothetical protein D3C81_1582170 [compost metagenome]